MKFNKSRQLMLVSAASLLVAGLLSACGTLTTDFVYVASAKAAGPNSYGEMDVFEINSESGFMRQIPTSPFPSGGRNPVAEVVSTDNTNLFVVNRDDHNVVQFIIGHDGKLYPLNTISTSGTTCVIGTPGTTSTSGTTCPAGTPGTPGTNSTTGATGLFPVAITTTANFVFVANTLPPVPGCSPASPCTGSVGVYPIVTSKDNPPSHSLAAPVANGGIYYWPMNLSGAAANDIIVPTGVNVITTGGSTYLFVAAYDSTVPSHVGYLFGYTVASSGVLSPISGSPFQVGNTPSAIGVSSNSNIYVTDSGMGVVYGFTIGSNGTLAPISGSPFRAGGQPVAIAMDPAYPYAYVANSLDSTLTAYSVGSNGALTPLGTYQTGSQPVAIAVDPSMHDFIFTANFLGNNLSNYQLNPKDGSLVITMNGPYPSNANPTAVAAIPHKH